MNLPAIKDYDVVLKAHPKGRMAMIPGLGLFATGVDEAEAYVALRGKFDELVQEHQTSGAMADFPKPVDAPVSVAIAYRLAPFFIKYAVIMLTLFMGAQMALHEIRRPLAAILGPMADSPRQMSEHIHDLADATEHIQGYKLERIHNDVKKFVAFLTPIVREMRPLVLALTEDAPKNP